MRIEKSENGEFIRTFLLGSLMGIMLFALMSSQNVFSSFDDTLIVQQSRFKSDNSRSAQLSTVLDLIPASPQEKEIIITNLNSQKQKKELTIQRKETPSCTLGEQIVVINYPYVCVLIQIVALIQFGGELSTDFSDSKLQTLVAIFFEQPEEMSQLSPAIGNLFALAYFYVSAAFEGSIPSELGKCGFLQQIDFSSCQFTTVPSELGKLSSLNRLALSDNRMTGDFPSNLFKLSNLEILNLHGNFLKKVLTPDIASARNLKEIRLNGNYIDYIPSEIGLLTKLNTLSLEGCRTSGTIPSELGNNIKLEYLDLSSNSLSGPIPSELGLLSNLEYLYLDENKLSGTLSIEIQRLSILQEFDISSNSLEGSITESFLNKTSIRCSLSGLVSSKCPQETICDECEAFGIKVFGCEGSNSKPTCLPVYIYLPPIIAGAFIIILLVKKTLPGASRQQVFMVAIIAILGSFDTLTDIGFAYSIKTPYNYISWGFIGIYGLINIIICIMTMRVGVTRKTSVVPNPEFEKRVYTNKIVYSFVLVLCLPNIRVLPYIINSREASSVTLLGRVVMGWALLAQNIPQLILQVIILSSGESSILVILSLIITAISIFIEFVGSLFRIVSASRAMVFASSTDE